MKPEELRENVLAEFRGISPHVLRAWGDVAYADAAIRVVLEAALLPSFIGPYGEEVVRGKHIRALMPEERP
jgi:hypothetical protein